jgi:hypothetical protein
VISKRPGDLSSDVYLKDKGWETELKRDLASEAGDGENPQTIIRNDDALLLVERFTSDQTVVHP